MHKVFWMHRKHEALGEFFTYIPDAVTHARKYFHKTNRSLIQQIQSEGPFLLGPNFSAVDIVYVHCLEWSKTIGWSDKWGDDNTLLAYLERCRSRPAYTRTRNIRNEEQKSKL